LYESIMDSKTHKYPNTLYSRMLRAVQRLVLYIEISGILHQYLKEDPVKNAN